MYLFYWIYSFNLGVIIKNDSQTWMESFVAEVSILISQKGSPTQTFVSELSKFSRALLFTPNVCFSGICFFEKQYYSLF